jgi:drug/metabolite transporter (DMT)-like permease
MSGAATPDREQTSRPGVWLTEALLLMMATIWGMNFSVVKYATGVLPPLAFNSARVTLAAVTLFLVVRAMRRPMPARRVVLRLLALGVLGNGLYQVLFVEGVARTRAGDAALILASSPAFIGVIGHLRGSERMTRRGAAGIALSILGIALVVIGGGRSGGGDATLLGGALVLLAALSWSVYTVLLQPYTASVDALALAAITMVGGVPFLLLASASAIGATTWGEVTPMAWGAVLYSGLLALVVAYLCWNRGVRVIGPTRTAMFGNLQPAIALVVAWATLGERPRIWQLVGAAAIFGGILFSRRREATA